MKGETVLMLGLGALAAYLLFPEKVKEVTGGGTGTVIDLGGLLSNMQWPDINIGGKETSGLSETDVTKIIEDAFKKAGLSGAIDVPGGGSSLTGEDAAGMIADALKKVGIGVPGGGSSLTEEGAAGVITDAFDKLKGKIPTIPGQEKDVWGPIKTQEAATWFRWKENFAKGTGGVLSAFDWIAGGWQEENTVVGAVAEALVNFFDPHHAVTLTDYARNVLAARSESANLGGGANPVTESKPTTKPVPLPATGGVTKWPVVTSQEQLEKLPMYIQREYW